LTGIAGCGIAGGMAITHPRILFAAGFALLALTAAPLHAFQATGTWTGQFSCKDFNGEKSTFKMKPSTLLISQSGVDVRAELDGNFRYHGTFQNDEKKPSEKGEMFLVLCGTDNNAGVDHSEMLHAIVKVNPTKGTGSFSGVSILEGDFGDGHLFGTCKFKFKLTGLPDPGVGPCQM
jgi:hypothetical protein